MEKLGIIGGSGIYQLDGIKVKKEVAVKTPFGKPSDKFIVAELDGVEAIFLPRHNRNHSISPSKINYRANIYGMKKLGVGWIVSVSACGSLRKEIKPLDFVVPSQFVDRTNQARQQTFFDDGIVAHVSLANPVCEKLSDIVVAAVKKVGVVCHIGKTYINMEGPQFSTIAESNLYRSWGMDIIGMTNMVEARLCREAEICYATLAAVTDYDCWYESEEQVTVDMIIANLKKNVENSKKVIKEIIHSVRGKGPCSCPESLKYAIMTRPDAISLEIREKLDILIGKYVK